MNIISQKYSNKNFLAMLPYWPEKDRLTPCIVSGKFWVVRSISGPQIEMEGYRKILFFSKSIYISPHQWGIALWDILRRFSYNIQDRTGKDIKIYILKNRLGSVDVFGPIHVYNLNNKDPHLAVRLL